MNLRNQVVGLFFKSFKSEKGANRKKRFQATRRRALFLEGLEARQLLAAFTPGNLAVYRVGDGSAPLATSGNAVFIDEFTPAGALVQSIAMPTSGTVKLISSGTTAAEGMLTLSPDGTQLALTGYNATIGAVANLPTSNTTTAQRTVAIVGADATSTLYAFGGQTSSGGDPRSAVVDGNNLYISGSTNGIRYAAISSLSTLTTNSSSQLSPTTTLDVRDLTIAGGQLYASAGTISNYRIGKVGTGTPISGGPATTPLSDTGLLVSPHQFFFADLSPTEGIDNLSPTKGFDTLYVSDDNGPALRKYSYNNVTSQWASMGSVGADADDYRGLTGSVSGTTVTLYAVRKGGTTSTGGGELVKLVDSSGYNGAFAGTPTLLFSASTLGANIAFRGVAFVPTSGIASAPEVNVQGGGLDIADEDGTPSAADGTQFGSLVVGETLTHTFTIQNTGSADLTLSNPISSDPNFSILNFPAGPIAAGASATFDVKFTAASVGTFSATISFDNNDSDELTYNFVVSGAGDANSPPVFVATGPYSVPENSAGGTVVGTVTASDPNGNQTLSFSALGTGTGAALFDINAAGEITVKSGAILDLESTSSYTFGVRVIDDGASPEHADTTVVINLSNVNEAPVFAAGAINRQILAGRSNGSVVVGGAISATDPDAGDSVVSYAIVGGNGTGAGAFAISNAGVISVNDATQITTAGVMNLQVTAIDSFGLASAAKTVTVTIVGNLAPVLDQHTYSFTVDENQANNSFVGEPISATDPNSGIGDTFTFSIVSGNGSGGGAFQIDAVTGQISVKDSTQLDREALAGFVLTVRATDSLGLFDSATVNISIFNMPEAPVFPAGQEFSISENSANGAPVGTVQATFDVFGVKSFSILGGNGTGAGAFAIDNTGKITVNDSTQLDYEGVVNHEFSLSIRARDTLFNLSTIQTVVVKLTNVQEGTILAPGDLLLTGIDGDDNDEFTFAPLVNLAAKTEIRFTDAGWLSSGGFRAGEGVIVYVAPAGGIAAGTEIGITKNGTTGVVSMSHGAGTAFDETGTTIFGLGTSGDSLIAFQGTTDTPTPLFAVTTNRATFDADAVDGSTTALPTGLTLGVTAVAVGAAATDFDNAEYTGPTAGSPTSLLTSVSNSDNWTKSDSRITFTYQDFTFSSPPTDIDLSNNTVAENAASGATVGVFSTVDPDIGDAFTYLLVAGTGADDNGSFTLEGAVLKTAATFNFEAKSSYTIRVRSTDNGGLFVEKAFVIGVTNVNEAPTSIGLAPNSIAENQASGTAVGTLSTTDVDAGDTFTYELVTGTGSTDNASFSVDGAILRTTQAFNFEAKNVYSIRVRSTDGGGLDTEKVLTVQITNVNEAPTAINLSANTLPENEPADTVVGTLSTTDVDAGDTFTYALVSGVDSEDNAHFTIDGATLKAAESFNFEAKSSYKIRIRSTDFGGLATEQAFVIHVTDVNEAPTLIALSANSLPENNAAGDQVGLLSTTDVDAGDSFTYTLVSGTGSEDNASFAIVGAALKAAQSFNFEAKSSYTVRVRSTDSGGLSIEQAFTIHVTDVNEAPTLISLSPNSVAENQPAGTEVGTLSSTDVDAGDSFTYTLVPGTGSTDNSAFTIDGDSLKTTQSFNYEINNSYSVRVRSTDSGGLATEHVLTIGVTDINDAPTAISLSLSVLPENQPSGALVGALSTTDEDASDTFTYSPVDGAGSEDNASFTIVGDKVHSLAAFNFEAKNVYSIRVQSVDAGGLATEQALTIQISDVNETPTAIDLSNKSLVEKEPVGAIVGNLITTDPDTGDHFTYTLVSGVGSDDNASFAIDGGVLKSAQMFDFLTKNSYQVRIRSTDSGGLFTEQPFTISISDVRIGVPLTPPAAVTYKENAVPALIASVYTVQDVELLDFAGGTLTAWISNNGTAEDRLSVKNVGLANGQISVVDDEIFITKKIGNVLTKVPIGTFAGGVGASPLVITFNANAFRAEVQAALRAITFKVESESPSSAPRTASFVITDGDGGISNTVTRTVNVTSINDKPVVTVTGTLVEFTENGGPMLIDSGVGISDVDSPDFSGGKLIVKFASGGQSTDRFEILDDGLINIDETSKTVSYFDTVFGTYAGTSALTVTLNAHANAAIVQELARHITYRSLSDAPTTTTRNVSFSLSDGDGATSVAATGDTVKITAVNDVPTLTVTNTTPATYNENAAPLLIASSGVVTDLDATNFEGGVLTAWISTNALPEDRLSIKDVGTLANQIHVDTPSKTIYFTNSTPETYPIATYLGGEGDEALVVTFNNRAFKAEVQATLRALTYENSSDAPSSSPRQISFTLTDGDGGATGVVYRDVNVVPKNDAATIANLGDSANWTIGPNPAFIAESAEVKDLDSLDFNGGKLIVSLTTNKQSADRIVIQDGDGITLDGTKVLFGGLEIGTFSSTTTLTVVFNSSDATVAAVQALLRRVSFRSTSISTFTRTVTFAITDGDGGTATPALSKLIYVN